MRKADDRKWEGLEKKAVRQVDAVRSTLYATKSTQCTMLNDLFICYLVVVIHLVVIVIKVLNTEVGIEKSNS